MLVYLRGWFTVSYATVCFSGPDVAFRRLNSLALGFNGVVVSDCLEMEAMSEMIGIGGGTVMVRMALQQPRG